MTRPASVTPGAGASLIMEQWMIDASSAPVWATAITVIGGIVTLIIQNFFASRDRQKLITKVDEVHTLANSTATAGLARESTQAAVIQELRAAGAIAQTDKAVAVALQSPGGHQAPFVSTPAGSEAAAAIAVADAAVGAKDEIVAKQK